MNGFVRLRRPRLRGLMSNTVGILSFLVVSLPPTHTHSSPPRAALAVRHRDGADVSSTDVHLEEPFYRGDYPEGEAKMQSCLVGCFVQTVFSLWRLLFIFAA